MVSLKSLATGTQGVSLVCVSLRCVLRRAPFVPMMQAADLRNLHNGTVCGRRDRTRNRLCPARGACATVRSSTSRTASIRGVSPRRSHRIT
jgi:hypothetical protein